MINCTSCSAVDTCNTCVSGSLKINKYINLLNNHSQNYYDLKFF